jgi:chromosome segregation ATPase
MKEKARMDQTSQQLTQSQQQATGLQTRVDQLTSLETKNQDLQNQNKQNQLLIDLLSARVDIAVARVALIEKDIRSAQAALNHMNGTLKTLQGLLPADQQSAVSEMQNRLKLATGELTSDTFAADSDMKVLAKSLDDLASKYPSNP